MKSTGLVFKSRDYIGSAEPPATVLEDESRFENNGTLSVEAGANGEVKPDWVQLLSGLWVLDFDGLGGYVNIGQDHSLDFVYALTIEAWVKPEGAHYQDEGVIFHDYYSDDDSLIRVKNDGSLYGRFLIPSPGGWRTFSVATPNLVPLNVWTYLVATYNGSEVVFWVNAVKQTPVGAAGKMALSTNDRKIGAGRVGRSWNFNGKIALFKLRNYALSAGQINKIFEAERHWFGV